MGLYIGPLQEPVEGPSAWTGAEMAARSDWINVLDASEVGELKAAADNATATGKPMEAVEQEDFPLSKLGSVLADVAATFAGHGRPAEDPHEGQAAAPRRHLDTAWPHRRPGSLPDRWIRLPHSLSHRGPAAAQPWPC